MQFIHSANMRCHSIIRPRRMSRPFSPMPCHGTALVRSCYLSMFPILSYLILYSHRILFVSYSYPYSYHLIQYYILPRLLLLAVAARLLFINNYPPFLYFFLAVNLHIPLLSHSPQHQTLSSPHYKTPLPTPPLPLPPTPPISLSTATSTPISFTSTRLLLIFSPTNTFLIPTLPPPPPHHIPTPQNTMDSKNRAKDSSSSSKSYWDTVLQPQQRPSSQKLHSTASLHAPQPSSSRSKPSSSQNHHASSSSSGTPTAPTPPTTTHPNTKISADGTPLYKCEGCTNYYKHKSSRSRHKKTCPSLSNSQ